MSFGCNPKKAPVWVRCADVLESDRLDRSPPVDHAVAPWRPRAFLVSLEAHEWVSLRLANFNRVWNAWKELPAADARKCTSLDYNGSPPFMSNKDRIARAAEEARITATEKTAKKAAKELAAPKPKRQPKAPARVKLVWEVCAANGKVLKTFAYPDKSAADAELARFAKSPGSHVLRSSKVPME